VPSWLIAPGSARVVTVLSLLADAATEGKHVVTGMLFVGLVFIGVIALGQFTHWVRHRSKH
jgi:hypothetical protein